MVKIRDIDRFRVRIGVRVRNIIITKSKKKISNPENMTGIIIFIQFKYLKILA